MAPSHRELFLVLFVGMSLAEIKDAVRTLSPKELTELAKFVTEQDNAAWDKQMEEDAARGKLDFLFDEAEGSSSPLLIFLQRGT